MLAETLLAITAFASGKAVRKKTLKEIKQFSKKIGLAPLLVSTGLTIIVLYENLNDFSVFLLGALLSFVFRNRKDNSQLIFATLALLFSQTNTGIITIMTLYFLVRGSLSTRKPLNDLTMILLGSISYAGFSFIRIITTELSSVLTSLFAGAVFGGELALATKNKSKN